MDKRLSYFPWLLSAALVLIIIFQRECGNSCTSCPEGTDTLKKTVYVYDSIPVTATFNKPQPKSQQFRQPNAASPTPDGVTYKPHSDENRACVQELFTARYYEETYRDSSIEAVFKDSVWSNQLTWSQFTYKLIRPTQINTTIITPPAKQRVKLFVGLSASAGVLPSAGPDILLLTKRDYGYRAGVKASPSGISYEAGIYWKIKLKR